MSFPKLDQYKQQSKEVARLLTNLEQFLEEVLSRPRVLQPLKSSRENINAIRESQNHAINPRHVARFLNVTEPVAIAILSICAKAGILEPRYDIYCPDTQGFIESFYSQESLPSEVECPNHDRLTLHSIDEYLVDFMFVFTYEALMNHLAYRN